MRLLEASRVRLFGACERLEPLGDLVEAFFARSACEAWIHLGVFVGLAGDGGHEVRRGVSDWKPCRRVADLGNVFHVAERMSGLAFSCVAEDAGDIRIAFDVRRAREE